MDNHSKYTYMLFKGDLNTLISTNNINNLKPIKNNFVLIVLD